MKQHHSIIATSTTLTSSKNNIQLTTTIATIKKSMTSHTSNNKQQQQQQSKKKTSSSVSTKKSSGSSSNHTITRTNNNKEKDKDDIWTSANYTEERQRIREFWLQLSETERRSLVKVEKEAVLRKMKEQQRHSCNCSVCGKKRTAIEDELDVLYDAYYEELEQYAYRQQQQQQLNYRKIGNVHVINSGNKKNQQQRIQPQQQQQQQQQAKDNSLSNDDMVELSNTLTVKGSIITVADDLLKNDGKKFLDMMERLAERKMSKEKEVINTFNKHHHHHHNSNNNSPTKHQQQLQLQHHHHRNSNTNSNNNRSVENTDDEISEDEEDEDDQDDDEDDDDDDDDDDEEDDDEEEEDSRTEEQRMEEGRKMFQVFAARMFEQRVLTAYREKVAQDRQRRLIEELEEEDRQRQERELKKQQEKEKKKEQKRQLKLQQEQERLELENKKKQEELAAKADKERKRQLANQLKEQERLKKEEEKRQKQEDRLRKEEKKRLAAEKAALEKKRREEEEEEEAAATATATAVAAETAAAAAAASIAAHLVNVQQEATKEKKVQEEKEKARTKAQEEEEEEEEEEAIVKNITTTTTTSIPQHVLTDNKTCITPIGQRRTSLAGPIGSPVRSRSIHHPFGVITHTDNNESQNSFFSNFLFGQPTIREHEEFNMNRRISTHNDNRWSNGWTPLTALSDNVHGKLFGDVLAASDRTSLILERARMAYFKLDEVAQNKFFMIPSFHTLDQLHRMMHETYFDVTVDLRELYDVLMNHLGGNLKCHYHQAQQCYVVSNMAAFNTSLHSPPIAHQVPGHHAL